MLDQELGAGTASPGLGNRQKEEQEMKTGMRLDDGMRDFLRYLAVALCSAIVTYLTTSPQPQDRNHFSDDGHWKSLFAKDKLSNY